MSECTSMEIMGPLKKRYLYRRSAFYNGPNVTTEYMGRLNYVVAKYSKKVGPLKKWYLYNKSVFYNGPTISICIGYLETLGRPNKLGLGAFFEQECVPNPNLKERLAISKIYSSLRLGCNCLFVFKVRINKICTPRKNRLMWQKKYTNRWGRTN